MNMNVVCHCEVSFDEAEIKAFEMARSTLSTLFKEMVKYGANGIECVEYDDEYHISAEQVSDVMRVLEWLPNISEFY